jgi:hypothetical protein
MKKLPTIFTNVEDKTINNNRKVYYSFKEKFIRRKKPKEKTPQ